MTFRYACSVMHILILYTDFAKKHKKPFYTEYRKRSNKSSAYKNQSVYKIV